MNRFMLSIASMAALLAAVLFACAQQAAAQQATHSVAGIVVDARTDTPLAGVLVRAGGREAVTDEAGRFRLVPPDAAAVLSIERLGYRELQLRVHELTSPVRLVPEPLLLDALTVHHHAAPVLAAGTALTVQSVAGDEAVAGHTTLAEALSGAEGVAVARVGSWGARPALRGLEGERVAILVDGSRVNRACAFGMDQGLASIDPNQVERVEIISGPGTALYGSGNIGGVINVVTRRGRAGLPFSGEVRAEASSAVPGGALGSTVRLERGRTAAALSLDGASYGDYRTPTSAVANSSFRHATADLHLSHQWERTGRVSLQAQFYEGRDIGWPSMGDAAIPRQSRRNFALDYGAQLGRGLLDGIAARAYIQRLDHDMDVRMMMSRTLQRSHSTTAGARAQLRLRPTVRSHADVGLEVTEWSAENTRTQLMASHSKLELRTWPGTSIRDLGAFAQGELPLGAPLTLSAGARIDRVHRSADSVPASDEWIGTGNAGLRLALPADLQLRAVIGWGYRLPDPTELFGLALRPDGFAYVGNTELQAERSRNLELSLSREGERLFSSLTLFRNDLSDLIAPALVPGDSFAGKPVRTYRNLSRARLLGLTGSLRLQATHHARVTGTLSYTEGEDTRSGAALPRIAPLHGTLTLRISPTHALLNSLELEGEGAARQTRNAAATAESATPAYLVLNARLGLDLFDNRITLGMDNAFDHAYRAHLDPVSLLRPGRNFYLRVTRSFGTDS